MAVLCGHRLFCVWRQIGSNTGRTAGFKVFTISCSLPILVRVLEVARDQVWRYPAEVGPEDFGGSGGARALAHLVNPETLARGFEAAAQVQYPCGNLLSSLVGLMMQIESRT